MEQVTILKNDKTKSAITSDKAPEIGDIIGEATSIFTKIVEFCAAAEKDNDLKNRINDFQDKLFTDHRSFFLTYPIVVRFMFEGKYHGIPFGKWLESLKGADWKKEDSFFESQAQYAMYLLRFLYPKTPVNNFIEVKNRIFTELKEDREKFKKNVKLAETNYENNVKSSIIDIKNKLKTYVNLNRESLLQELDSDKLFLPKPID